MDFKSAFGQGVYKVEDIFHGIHAGTYPTSKQGYFMGGYDSSTYYTTMEFVRIQILSNTTSFGNLSSAVFGPAGISLQDGYSAVIAGGNDNLGTDLTFVLLWKMYAQVELGLFNKLTYARKYVAAVASTTRAVFGGGQGVAYTDTIDYIPCANPDNTATDFGNLYHNRARLDAVFSTTRGVFGGGTEDGSLNTDMMDYITIATTGNAVDFGNLTQARRGVAALHNYSRGVFGGGYTTASVTTIDYITIASTGNATTFGSLTTGANRLGGCSDSVRGIFGGGANTINVIGYITIASTGSAEDFGDLANGRYSMATFAV